MKTDAKAIGSSGEDLAAEMLVREGYQILERNWTSGKAEIDIIAFKDNVLVIVEVKSRSSLTFGEPQEFVKPAQIRNLIGAVNNYVESLDSDPEVRFDIIAIHLSNGKWTANHIQDAFFHFNSKG